MQEAELRLTAFIILLLLFAFLERLSPRRRYRDRTTARWGTNLGMALASTLLLRFVLILLPVPLMSWLQSFEVGLFYQIELGYASRFFLSILILDLVIYFQHRAFHRIPILWALHKVHHTDLDFDVSTGVRFHPVEIMISYAIKLTAVTLMGAPIEAYIAFEILLNGTSLFNHMNTKLPSGLDRTIRLVLVTPDMHRVHHSANPKETDQNFGFSLSWWDYLFRTYTAQPNEGHTDMKIGLNEYREGEKIRLLNLLKLPFMRK